MFGWIKFSPHLCLMHTLQYLFYGSFYVDLTKKPFIDYLNVLSFIQYFVDMVKHMYVYIYIHVFIF